MNELETWQRAEQLLAQKQVLAARQQYIALRGSVELGIAARMRLSMIAGAMGNFREAVDEVVGGTADLHQQSDPHALSMLFKRLIGLGEQQLALRVARARALRECHDIEPLAEVGKLLSDHGFPEDALTFLERALAKGLASAPLHFLIGTCRMRLGDKDRAEQNLERGIALDAGFSPNHWQLSKLRRQTNASNHVDRLRRALAQARQPSDRAALGYALFKELDDLGDYQAAWDAWQPAAATMKSATGYQLQRDTDLLQQLADVDRQCGELATNRQAASAPTPIFIVGLPRSGTTLFERMLGRHSAIAVGGELGDLVMQLRYVANQPGVANLDQKLVASLPEIEYAAWGQRYEQHVAWRGQEKACLTDKLPTNFRLVGFILRALPGVRIIHMERDPLAACFSNLRECFFGGSYGYSNDLADMAGYYRAYRELMAHWDQRYPGRVHRVRYNELVTETRPVLEQALRYCGYDWEDACLDTGGVGDVVASASAAQVREPIHTRSVAHWRHYEKQLQPMIDALGDHAEASR